MSGGGFELARGGYVIGLVEILEPCLLAEIDMGREFDEGEGMVDGRGLVPDDGTVLVDRDGDPVEKVGKVLPLTVKLEDDVLAVFGLAVDGRAVMVAPLVLISDRHDGPGHNPVSTPNDKFISMSGRCEDFTLNCVEGRGRIVDTEGSTVVSVRGTPDIVTVLKEVDGVGLEGPTVGNPSVVVETVILAVFDDRHEGPGQTPVKMPKEKLISIRGGLNGAGPETTTGSDELLRVIADGDIDTWALLAVLVDDLQDEAVHKASAIPSDSPMSISGRRVEIGADDAAGRIECVATRDVAVTIDESALEPGELLNLPVVVDLHAEPVQRPPSSPSDRSRLMSGVREEVGTGTEDVFDDSALIVGRVVDVWDKLGNDPVRDTPDVVDDRHAGSVQRPPRRFNDTLISIRGFLLEVALETKAGDERDTGMGIEDSSLLVDVTPVGEDGPGAAVEADGDGPPLEVGSEDDLDAANGVDVCTRPKSSDESSSAIGPRDVTTSVEVLVLCVIGDVKLNDSMPPPLLLVVAWLLGFKADNS